jgi:hypothetical protein
VVSLKPHNFVLLWGRFASNIFAFLKLKTVTSGYKIIGMQLIIAFSNINHILSLFVTTDGILVFYDPLHGSGDTCIPFKNSEDKDYMIAVSILKKKCADNDELLNSIEEWFNIGKEENQMNINSVWLMSDSYVEYLKSKEREQETVCRSLYSVD